jgi:stringent starvation protein B
MAGPSGDRTGQLKARFGAGRKRVSVPAKALLAARAGKGRLFEDGSFTPNKPKVGPPAPTGGPMKAGPTPAPQAVANASPNARFKRGAVGPPTGQTRPTTPQPAAKSKTLPRPPAKRY